MLNTSNYYGKVSEIMFKILKKAMTYIDENNILKTSFLVNWKDNIDKQEKEKDKSTEISKPNIKPVSKNKKKGK